MFFLEKIIEIYRNDTITMIQINALTLLFIAILYDYWKARKNPLSMQVLERMRKSQKKKRGFSLSEPLEFFRTHLGKIEKRAELRLARANLDFTAKEYVTFFMIGIVGGAIIGFVVFPFAGIFKSMLFFLDDNYFKTFVARIISTISFAAVGTLTPSLWTKRLIRKRKKALEEQLLEFLMSLADGVKSSPTPQEAMIIVAKEMPDPISSELNKTIQELNYAKPYEDSLRDLASRINIKEYSLAINALQIQNQTGGELEKLLRTMAKVFQERQELMSEVKKIVRGPKTTSYILLGAPFVIALLFSLSSKGFFDSLFSSTIGWGCVIAAIIMYIIAFLLIIRINKYVDKVV